MKVCILDHIRPCGLAELLTAGHILASREHLFSITRRSAVTATCNFPVVNYCRRKRRDFQFRQLHLSSLLCTKVKNDAFVLLARSNFVEHHAFSHFYFTTPESLNCSKIYMQAAHGNLSQDGDGKEPQFQTYKRKRFRPQKTLYSTPPINLRSTLVVTNLTSPLDMERLVSPT